MLGAWVRCRPTAITANTNELGCTDFMVQAEPSFRVVGTVGLTAQLQANSNNTDP